MLELAVLGRNHGGAEEGVSQAVDFARVPWELETTIRNIRFMREKRKARGEDVAWMLDIEAKLDAKRQTLEAARP